MGIRIALTPKLTVRIVGAVRIATVIGDARRRRGGALAGGQAETEMLGHLGVILMVYIVEYAAAGHFHLCVYNNKKKTIE